MIQAMLLRRFQRSDSRRLFSAAVVTAVAVCVTDCGGSSSSGTAVDGGTEADAAALVDPGTSAWVPVPASSGRKTGPLSDTDRVDRWLDAFTYNKDAQVAHVLAMVAASPSLALG